MGLIGAHVRRAPEPLSPRGRGVGERGWSNHHCASCVTPRPLSPALSREGRGSQTGRSQNTNATFHAPAPGPGRVGDFGVGEARRVDGLQACRRTGLLRDLTRGSCLSAARQRVASSAAQPVHPSTAAQSARRADRPRMSPRALGPVPARAPCAHAANPRACTAPKCASSPLPTKARTQGPARHQRADKGQPFKPPPARSSTAPSRYRSAPPRMRRPPHPPAPADRRHAPCPPPASIACLHHAAAA